MMDSNKDQFRVLCNDVVNKISNVAEQSCGKMEEMRAELKAKEEKLKCENSFKIVPKIQGDINEFSEKNLQTNAYSEDKVESKETCSLRKSVNDGKETSKSQMIYNARHERFQEFKKIERVLCYELGISTKYEKFEMLSPKRMEQCKKDLQKLYLLKKKRQQHYHQIITEIKGLLSEMEIFTWSEFEKDALNESEFIVTKENLNALHEWKIRLIDQFESERKLIEDLKRKLADLWDKLSIDVKTRQEFFTKIHEKQGRKYIFNELQMELHKCEKIWRQKIRENILDLRKEIIDLWVECHVGQKQRDRFIAFNSEVFDEELMTLHKQEIERLRNMQRETEELNELAIKWSDLRGKLVEMENGNKNTNRFNNRGGSLLKEEKERKKFQKNISTLESKLIHMAAKYKLQHNCHFNFNGRPILQLIEASRIYHSKKGKENQTKNNKISQKKENVKCLYKPRLSYHNSFSRCALRI